MTLIRSAARLPNPGTPAKSRIKPALFILFFILLISLPVALGVLLLIRPHNQWHPARVTWIPSTGTAAAIHITDVSAVGRVVTLSIASDVGFSAHDLVITYAGMYGGLPLPSEIPPGLTGMLAPILNNPGDRANKIIEGTNTAHGPGTFRFGFYLPDEMTAATAADMARRLYAGKTCRLDQQQSLILFQLESNSTGMAGQPGNVFSAQLILLPSSAASPSSSPDVSR